MTQPGQNIYEFLLSIGAPPETIGRLMQQMKGGQSIFQTKPVGLRGNASGFNPVPNRPTGAYAPPTPPRA